METARSSVWHESICDRSDWLSTRAGYWTVNTAVPVTPSTDAEIVVVPESTARAVPTELIVATEFVVEPQVTCRVMSMLDPSLKLPVALNDCVVPRAIDALEGDNVIDVSVALLTVSVAVPT
jgi:hypothetical protein